MQTERTGIVIFLAPIRIPLLAALICPSTTPLWLLLYLPLELLGCHVDAKDLQAS